MDGGCAHNPYIAFVLYGQTEAKSLRDAAALLAAVAFGALVEHSSISPRTWTSLAIAVVVAVVLPVVLPVEDRDDEADDVKVDETDELKDDVNDELWVDVSDEL